MSADGKGQPPTNGRISPEDRDAIRKRSEAIGQKLDAVKSRGAPAKGSTRGTGQSGDFGPAFKFAGELIVGVIVGGGVGWAFDKQFGTAPWLMVVLLILGFAAGLLNVVRSARQAQARNEPLQRAAPSVADDEDD